MVETVLGGVVIALVSGIVGKAIGEKGKVSMLHCSSSQKSCQLLILEKLNNLDRNLKSLTDIVNDKVLGL